MLRPVTALVLLTTLAVPLLQHHHDDRRDEAPTDRTRVSARFEHPVLRPTAPAPGPGRAQEPTGPTTGTLGPDDVVVPTPVPAPAPRAVIRPL